MEMTLEHAPIDDLGNDIPDDGPRLCACGCGEPLRDGAKRAFIRGHKARMESEFVDKDPDPGDEPPKSSRSRVTASAKVRREIQDSVETYLGMFAAGWAIRDPLCGNAALDIVPNVAAKLTPILSKNASFVKYFSGSSSFKEGMDLFMAVLPLLQMVYAHHMAHTIVTPDQQNPEEVVNYNDYVA